jgi:LPS sulfotransferase NodH
MKSVIILTEGRSGSNWLGSLTSNTGYMGRSEEWLDVNKLGFEPDNFEDFISAVIRKASTDNGRLCIKIFPRHLNWFYNRYNVDFIKSLMDRTETGLILLKRRDRIRQAISFSRGRMTRKFRSTHQSIGEEFYDFDAICQLYWYIDRSYCFWSSYLNIHEYEYHEFYYEDLLNDPAKYVDCVSNILSVPRPESIHSALEIQRDEKTEEWVKRFKSDMKQKDFLESLRDRPASRTFGNFVRFASKEPMTGSTQLFSQY